MNLDVEILKALRAAGDGAVSGAELSQRLGISRAAIWARIEELAHAGLTRLRPAPTRAIGCPPCRMPARG